MSPELLPFQEKLVRVVSDLVSRQEKTLSEQLTRDQDDRFYANIMKMELERVKFILKSYLRTRLFKIERHILFIVEKDQSGLLSPGEMQFAFALYESRKTHFNDNLFKHVPRKLNFMDADTIADEYSKSFSLND